MFESVFIDIANQLDEGKGMAKTVEAVKDANNRTALHFAAREGKIEICEFLLGELKLDPDARDDDGMLFFLTEEHSFLDHPCC
jgi:Ankyrin repeats (many copies)